MEQCVFHHMEQCVFIRKFLHQQRQYIKSVCRVLGIGVGVGQCEWATKVGARISFFFGSLPNLLNRYLIYLDKVSSGVGMERVPNTSDIWSEIKCISAVFLKKWRVQFRAFFFKKFD